MSKTTVRDLVPKSQRVVADLLERVEKLEELETAVRNGIIELTGQAMDDGGLQTQIDVLAAEVAEINAFLRLKYKSEAKAEEQAKQKKRKAYKKYRGQRGVYCLQCHKLLNQYGRNQSIFCSPNHASDWRKAHPGEEPYPLMKLHSGGFETKIAPGEAVESAAYAGVATAKEE